MRRLPSSVLFLLASALPSQTVHLVGPGGFAQITQAIAAAANGDVVLIQSGAYTPFTLAKDLTLTAASGAVVEVMVPPFTVGGPTDLQPPTFAKIAGLRFRATISFVGFSQTRVLSGTVHFADCSF